jgi:CRISPR/Cas system CSM-associated protein Csm2 small subunit
MEEQQFEQIVERVRAADAVVATLDPAVRSQAFAMLTDQTASEMFGRGGRSGLGLLTAGTDIAEVAFVVLMGATRDADQDLQDIMAGVRAVTNAKTQLRNLLARVQRDVAENVGASAGKLTFAADGLGNEDSYHHAGLPVVDAESGGVRTVPTDLHPGGPVTTEDQLRAIRDDLRDRLDSMNAMSEMTSLRLQMAMDRRSKFVETLSNIMKKIDDTQETIVQNLKG